MKQPVVITQLLAVDDTGTVANYIRDLEAQRDELLAALQGIMAQFEAGAFVRNTYSDGLSDWAIRAIGPLKALAEAKAAIAKAESR